MAACSSTQIKSTTPYISLHPKSVANQLQIALQMTAPNSPVQYSNANAVLAASDTNYASSAAAAINSASNPPSSVSNISSSAPSASTSSTPGVTTASYELPTGMSPSLSTANNAQPAPAQTQGVQAQASQPTASSSKQAAELSSAKIHAIASLRPEIETMLVEYGFVPVTYQPQLQRKLTVRILSLSNSSGLQMVIEVDAINGMLTYSRTYSGSASSISIGNLNERTAKLFGDLLTQALGDSQLISFLNQP
jgi:hypothetical protein